jgi:hypothetical protein
VTYLLTTSSQDDSIKEGLNDAQYCSVGDLYLGNKVLSTFQYVQHLVYDSAAILADLIVDFIHEYYGMHYFTSENSLILEGLLVNLHNEGYDCAKYRLGDIPSAEEFRWDRQTLCKLMLLLVEAGANMSGANHISTCHIPRLINYDFDIRMRWAFDDLLYAYMQAGSDVHALNDMKQTPSISARHLDFWPLWCQALQDSGKEIEEVLLAEGNEWLLADNWEDIFFEQFGECDCGNCDYGDSDCEDSDCEDSDDGHGDDEQSNDNPGSSRVGATKGASTSGAQSEL